MSIIGNPLIIGSGTQEAAGVVFIYDKPDGNGGIIRDITTEDGIITETTAADGSTIVSITGAEVYLEEREVDPTESEQEITPNTGYDAMSKVTVGAIPSDYVGSDITERSSTDLQANGATITAPAGYYPSSASKTVQSGSVGSPSATKGTVSNHTITVTPSVSYNEGYISGGTSSGTAVSVSASELVSGTLNITSSGTKDVTNYASASVAAGTATTPATTITPNDISISVNSSTGLITASNTQKTQNVTPTVSAGYVSSGTAGTITVAAKSATSQLSTQAGTTITPTESEQTAVAAGKYTLGAVKVGAISSTYVGSGITQRTSTDLTASGATVTAPAGYYASAATKSVASGSATTPATTITANPSLSNTYTSGNGYKMSVSATKSVTPTVSAGYVSSGTAGTITVSGEGYVSQSVITNNTTLPSGSTSSGTIDSSKYIKIGAGYYPSDRYYMAQAQGTIQTQTKSATPTESEQEIVPDSGYYLTGVTVGAISSTYVGSAITRRSSSDLSASGATVTVPAGYYSAQATKSVSSMTLPTAASSTSSGTSKATISRSTSNQYINIPTGYNSTASYYTISAVPNGSVTAPSSISGTSATVTTGTNTLTFTKTISVTPNVTTAGYISSGTAGNASVSLTASINTRSSSDLTASGATVTVPSGYYASQATKSVSSGTEGTPTATKGTVSNHSISVTPSVTNSAGYISGGTKTGTAVTVSASELVSGSQTITSNQTVDVTNLAEVVVNVAGGGSLEESDVNFIDYDGTLLYSYTKEDFANLSALPSNPNRTSMGLSAQGWNWSLSDAKSYVASYGKLWVGQEYDTISGWTEIDVEFNDPLFLSPYLKVAVNGTIEVDWGDGSAVQSFTATGTSTARYYQHTFPQINTRYTIKIRATSGQFVFYNGGSTSYASVLVTSNTSHTASDQSYSTCIKAIRIGSASNISNSNASYLSNLSNIEYITMPSCGFIYRLYLYDWRNLKALVIPHGVTSMSYQRLYSLERVSLPYSMTSLSSFSSCGILKSVTVPPQITSLTTSCFYNCVSLREIVLPSSITTLNSQVFYNCTTLKKIKFTGSQAVTLSGTSVFASCYTLDTIEGLNFGNATTLQSSTFSSCHNLKGGVTLPSGLTAIPSYFFNYCYAMEKVVIPSTVTSIGTYGLGSLYGLHELRLEPTTPPTLSTSYSISDLNLGCKIYVPVNSIPAYISATNYPSSSTYTYLGYGTYSNNSTLPTRDSSGNYALTWYATKANAIAQTSPITKGNGSEVYCRYVYSPVGPVPGELIWSDITTTDNSGYGDFSAPGTSVIDALEDGVNYIITINGVSEEATCEITLNAGDIYCCFTTDSLGYLELGYEILSDPPTYAYISNAPVSASVEASIETVAG